MPHSLSEEREDFRRWLYRMFTADQCLMICNGGWHFRTRQTPRYVGTDDDSLSTNPYVGMMRVLAFRRTDEAWERWCHWLLGDNKGTQQRIFRQYLEVRQYLEARSTHVPAVRLQ